MQPADVCVSSCKPGSGRRTATAIAVSGRSHGSNRHARRSTRRGRINRPPQEGLQLPPQLLVVDCRAALVVLLLASLLLLAAGLLASPPQPVASSRSPPSSELTLTRANSPGRVPKLHRLFVVGHRPPRTSQPRPFQPNPCIHIRKTFF